LIGLTDALFDTKHADTCGSFSLFGNVSLLHAEFVAGINDGNTPAYAPDYVIKGGATWRWRDRVKVGLTGTLVDEMFWQDSNAAGTVGANKIPAYGVWDLTGEFALYKNTVTVVAGINNLFDEDYYSRIRSDGIEPAARRNFFAGVKILLP
jgi:Fe(3+) dicitrate transport protein